MEDDYDEICVSSNNDEIYVNNNHQSNNYGSDLHLVTHRIGQEHSRYISSIPENPPFSQRGNEYRNFKQFKPIQNQSISSKSLHSAVGSTLTTCFKYEENLKLKASKKRTLTNFCHIGLATLIIVIALAAFALAVVAFIKSKENSTGYSLVSFARFESEIDELQSENEKLRSENGQQQRQIEELRAHTLFPTCAYADVFKNLSNGMLFISPNLEMPPFQVNCSFSSGKAETIIYHNFPNEVDAGDCEPQRCARHNITYDITIEQIIEIIKRSADCHQFIKYRCLNSRLFTNETITFATWLSRDGVSQIYWGGATSRRDRYCACGETNSCVNRRWKCNCDVNNSTETLDEGFLTDKDKLPVTGLQFGDLKPIENGWFTLGPLICTGRAIN